MAKTTFPFRFFRGGGTLIIPSDRPELLESAQPGDEILEFIKPLKHLEKPYDEGFRFFIRRLSANSGKYTKRIELRTKTLIVLKIGGGIEGRSNLNAALSPLKIERSEPYYAVKWWKVLEVITSSKD